MSQEKEPRDFDMGDKFQMKVYKFGFIKGIQSAKQDEIKFLEKRKHLLYSAQANTLLSAREDIQMLIKETEERLQELNTK